MDGRNGFLLCRVKLRHTTNCRRIFFFFLQTIFTLLIIHNVSMMNFIPYQVRVHLDGGEYACVIITFLHVLYLIYFFEKCI